MSKSVGFHKKTAPRSAAAPMRIADHLVKIINQLSRFDTPADAVLSVYFRSHPKLGSGDRHWIAEAAYTWLRFKPRITHLCEGGQGPVPQRWAQLSLLMVNAPQKLWALGAV
jgi:16S rRNA (cytosine967-C5)-methyltransferase